MEFNWWLLRKVQQKLTSMISWAMDTFLELSPDRMLVNVNQFSVKHSVILNFSKKFLIYVVSPPVLETSLRDKIIVP